MNRVVDQGAVFAGWVGIGMALVLAIAFELIIPVQTLVFLLAPLMGVLIGVYANVRSERWRPRGRVLANAAYAAVVTGVAVAVLVRRALRLVFIYGDTGAMPDGTSIACQTGPDCIYRGTSRPARQTSLRRWASPTASRSRPRRGASCSSSAPV